MSCIDNASPTWSPGLLPDLGGFAYALTENYLDTLPAVLLAEGYTCEQAKQAIYDQLMTFAQFGSFAVVRNGVTVPAYVDGMVIPPAGEIDFLVEVRNDSALVNQTSSPPLSDPWQAKVAGVDFLLLRQFIARGYVSQEVATIQIPVTEILTAFDFEVWWSCASPCVAPPPQRPTPRLGMQTLSNFTYSVINSFGQVPRI